MKDNIIKIKQALKDLLIQKVNTLNNQIVNLTNEIEELKSKKLTLSDKDGQPKIDNEKVIEVRIGGKWKKEAFWLDHNYNWKIEKDDEDEWCLIPSLKDNDGEKNKIKEKRYGKVYGI